MAKKEKFTEKEFKLSKKSLEKEKKITKQFDKHLSELRGVL